MFKFESSRHRINCQTCISTGIITDLSEFRVPKTNLEETWSFFQPQYKEPVEKSADFSGQGPTEHDD